jgi:hypothetical protein
LKHSKSSDLAINKPDFHLTMSVYIKPNTNDVEVKYNVTNKDKLDKEKVELLVECMNATAEKIHHEHNTNTNTNTVTYH